MPLPAHILAGVRDLATTAEERVDALAETAALRLERILSPPGHVSPPGQWFDSDRDEWVLVVQGRGALAFEDGTELALNPGDHLHLPAHRRHRVAWTDAHQVTVWLALHYDSERPS